MYYDSRSYRIKAFRLDESSQYTAPWWFATKVTEGKVRYDIAEDDEGEHVFGAIVKDHPCDAYANL